MYKHNKPAWPNGYGVGLLNRRLGVRVPPWVNFYPAITLQFYILSSNSEGRISKSKMLKNTFLFVVSKDFQLYTIFVAAHSYIQSDFKLCSGINVYNINSKMKPTGYTSPGIWSSSCSLFV